ncbi:MAG: TonB-dependent receptor [Tannerellaceae bacterium]|nr:TonB-dependent receptor [Tannerellaceae bacterium]
MKKRFTLIFAWLLLCFTLTAANTPRIRGRILEAGSNKPVDFADILLFKNGNINPVTHALPDVEGRFQLDDIADGEYELMVKLVGYDLFTRTGIVLSAASPVVDLGVIPMHPLEVGLAEVEVVAQKKQVIYKLDKKVIEASSNIVASGGSAVDILENTPSIRVDAEGEVTFRGSSGFLVYIDGKPSVFSGTQALEQIPAGHIDNIEIITTPSARHDTDGDVGIINIITKKNARQGLSGMVNVTGSTVLSRGIDFLLTQQNEHSRWYVGGSWNDRLRKSNFKQTKTTLVNDTTTTSYSDGPRESNNFNYSLKTGWMYSLPATTFTIDVEGGYGGRLREGDLDYTETRMDAGGKVFEKGDYYSRDDYDLHETYFQGTIGVDHKFNDKGHQLSAGFYLKYGGDAMEYFQSDLYDRNNRRQQGHRAWEDEHRWTVRGNLDYVLPYRESGRIEAGYQYFSYLEDGDYSMQFWDPVKGEFYWRDDIYNTFYFQEGINSIYAILAESFHSFDIQAGVRAEHTHRVLRSSIEGADRTFNKFEFFPSVHAGYTFPHDHKVLFGYSRRTTRPELFFMEPYITYRDFYSAEIGNPDIRPEYINTFELNYKKNIGEHGVSATLFHRSRKDKIERLRVPYEAGVTLDSMANVGHDYATGIEVSGQVQVSRRWHSNLNGSLYHYKVKNDFKVGEKDETSTNYDINWNNVFEVGKYTRIQVDANFVGPSVTTQGRTDAFWYANLAVRQQLMKRRLTATLAFRDLFNSARYVSTITTSTLYSNTKIRPDYPLVSLTLSYTFNNFRMRASQATNNHDLFEGTNH